MEIRRDVFQAVADPARRAILGLMALQAMTPGAIAENFDSTRQTISKHIQILNECGLLNQIQSSREIYYHFNPKEMKEIADWLEPYRNMWEGRLTALDDILNEMQTNSLLTSCGPCGTGKPAEKARYGTTMKLVFSSIPTAYMPGKPLTRCLPPNG